MPDFSFRQASIDDTVTVAVLITDLLQELDPNAADSYQPEGFMGVITEFLSTGCEVTIFIVEDEAGVPCGLVTLNECRAIYAGGVFGEISELYIKPDMRSSGLGAKLLGHVKEYARSKGWRRLEVGTPGVTDWVRTADFYRTCGFIDVGLRLKHIL